jgi:hypothetical protein
MRFPDLVTHITEVNDTSRMSAGRLIQQALGLQNGIIGAVFMITKRRQGREFLRPQRYHVFGG